ncbi:hypothetical protein [Ramlibacter sp.]|uniref:hypothetical protein n=1 Tax=Ramlibacter sp. TaxID=1917967 RepID=UPI002FC9D83E
MNLDFEARASEALRTGELSAVTDEELARVMTLATQLYAAKSEQFGLSFHPVSPEVSATEVVATVSGMLHAANLNLFDVAMWYRRPGCGEIAAGGMRS